MTDNSTRKNIIITAAILTGFAIAGAVLVGITFINTKDDIKLNEERVLLDQLNTIIPKERYNNDLLEDTITLDPEPLLGTTGQTKAYRARKDGKPVAVVFTSVAPNGYNGPIEMLVGVYEDGTTAGVRVVKHRETPGLGDAIDTSHSDWILGFNQKSLSNPSPENWKVKRDGGIFDQFTGATITPRAVVKAVHNALLYFSRHKDALFNKQPLNKQTDSSGTDNTAATGKNAVTGEPSKDAEQKSGQ
jgi:Na+-translocating ferredoxin:NAD+ oxidoreductase subunit G